MAHKKYFKKIMSWIDDSFSVYQKVQKTDRYVGEKRFSEFKIEVRTDIKEYWEILKEVESWLNRNNKTYAMNHCKLIIEYV